MVRGRAFSTAADLLAWLLALALLIGFLPTPQYSSSSAAVATVLIRASEPSDISPTEPSDTVFEQHPFAVEAHGARWVSSAREMRSLPTWRHTIGATAVRPSLDEVSRLPGRSRPATDRHASRTHLRLMLFLI